MVELVRFNYIFVLIVGIFLLTDAAKWIDVGEKVKRNILFNQNSMKTVDAKRSSKLTVRDLVEASDGEDFTEIDMAETAEGENIVRYKETYEGLEVFDAFVTVDVNKKTGEFTERASGNMLGGISDDVTSVEPKLSQLDALSIAKSKFDLDPNSVKYSSEKSKLIIYMENNRAVLSYKVSFLATLSQGIKRPVVILDANTGRILMSWDRATAHQYKSTGGNKKIGKFKYGEDWPYLNIAKDGEKCMLKSKNVVVVHLHHKNSPDKKVPFTFDCKKGFNDELNGAYSQLSDAFFFAENTFKMYKSWVKLPPVKEIPVVIWVHKGQNKVEAFWSGEYVAFGDGNPDFIYPLVSADVLAHELAHAFTEEHSDLLYFHQSGAINEAFSDLSGEALEFFLRGTVDYSAGGDVTKYDMGTRELCDQSMDGRSVTHVDDYDDSLDVHYTSGIFNKAICLISKSEGFTIKTTFQIFSHANRFYWHEQSGFDDAACGVVKAAYDLGYDPSSIYKAFTEVGIDGCVLNDHVRLVGAHMSLNGLSGVKGQKLMFKIDLSEVPFSKSIQVLTIGGSGDVDIYVHRRTSFKMTKALLFSSNKGNLEVLNIPRTQFPKGYCFVVLTPKDASFKDVTLTTDIAK